MSMFDELLAIKQFREGRAELELAHQRSALNAARVAQEQAQKALADFHDYAQRLEASLFGDLCSRVVRVREIDDVLLSVAGLRDGERQRAERLEEARRQSEHATQAFEHARQLHVQAGRKVEKFEELSRDYLATQARQIEQKTDLDMEEAASLAREREEWEQDDTRNAL